MLASALPSTARTHRLAGSLYASFRLHVSASVAAAVIVFNEEERQQRTTTKRGCASAVAFAREAHATSSVVYHTSTGSCSCAQCSSVPRAQQPGEHSKCPRYCLRALQVGEWYPPSHVRAPSARRHWKNRCLVNQPQHWFGVQLTWRSRPVLCRCQERKRKRYDTVDLLQGPGQNKHKYKRIRRPFARRRPALLQCSLAAR